MPCTTDHTLRSGTSTTGLLLACVFLAGCVGTRVFDPEASSSRQEINQQAYGRTITVHTIEGRRYQAQALSVGADSTTWTDPSGQRFCEIANGAIKSLRVPRPGRGVAVGLGVGGLAGLVGGLVFGAARVSAADDEVGQAVGTLTAPLWAVIGFGVGLLTGGLVGGVAGSDHYRAATREDAPSRLSPACRAK